SGTGNVVCGSTGQAEDERGGTASVAGSTSRGRSPICRAGTPPTIVNGAVSCVTTAPALTIVPSATLIPGRITALAPIHTSEPIVTGAVWWPSSAIGSRGSS